MTDLIYKNEVFAIVGAAMEVHRYLGSGFLEAVYQEAMEIEMNEKNIPFVSQQILKIQYKQHILRKEYVADVVCFEKIIVEFKALDKLTEFVAEFDNLDQTAILQGSKHPNKDARNLQERLAQSFPDLDFPIIQYGPDLATRVGPNALGIAVYEGMKF